MKGAKPETNGVRPPWNPAKVLRGHQVPPVPPNSQVEREARTGFGGVYLRALRFLKALQVKEVRRKSFQSGTSLLCSFP